MSANPSPTALHVVARVIARPETVDTLRSVLSALIEPTRKEPGCIAYHLLENRSDPTDFTFVEIWSDGDALDAHLQTEHFLAAAALLPDLVAAEPDIRRYSVVG